MSRTIGRVVGDIAGDIGADIGASVGETAAQRIAREAAASAAQTAAQRTARDGAQGVAETAAQRAARDSAGGVAETAAQRAAREGAGGAAETAAQRAARDGAGGVGETAAQRTARRGTKDAATKTSYSTIVGGAALGGLTAYVYTQMKDEDAAIQECVTECLPTNYDAYMYEDLDKSELEYSSIEPTADQPVCKEETEEECGEHCMNTCEDIHETSLFEKMGPLGDVAAEVVDEAGDVAEDATNDIFEALGLPPLTGPDGLFAKFGKAIKIGGIICLFLCLVYILFMVF
jgi:hypothetical protein